MSEDGAERVKRMTEFVSKAPCVNPKHLKLRTLREEGPFFRAIFFAKTRDGRSVAIKCFCLEKAGEKERDQVCQEFLMASWAGSRGIGAPVVSWNIGSSHGLLVMDLALGDLEGLFLFREHVSYLLVKDLFAQAFSLVSHPKLVSGGFVCPDLKLSNFLIYSSEPHKCMACELASVVKKGWLSSLKGLALEVKMGDFDPYFWKCVASEDVSILNSFFLLANSLLWKPLKALKTYLPQSAVDMVGALEKRNSDVLAVLYRHEELLKKGPLHYGCLKEKAGSPLDLVLKRLEASFKD